MGRGPQSYFVIALTTAAMAWFSLLLGFGSIRGRTPEALKHAAMTALGLFFLGVLGYLVASLHPTAGAAWGAFGVCLTVCGISVNGGRVCWFGLHNGVPDRPRRAGMLLQASLPMTLVMWPGVGPVALAITLFALLTTTLLPARADRPA
jgi:hypothetical protein